MSLAIFKHKQVKVSDPRLDFDNEGVQVITEAATNITYQRIPATNFAGNVVKFSTIISPSLALSTKMFVRTQFEVTLSGIPDPGTTLYQVAHDAPRFMPLAAITDNAVLYINGTSTTIQTNYFYDALMRYYNNFEQIAKDLSTCPSMFDYYQVYSDYLQFGSGLNSLGQIGEAGPGIEGRGGFPISIDSTNPNSVKITFETYEPVIIPPLVWTKENHKSLIGVKNLDLTYNIGDFSRVWSRSETNSTPVVVSARISNTPELTYILLTPKMVDKVPRVNIYPYTQINPQSQNFGVVQPGAVAQVSFNAQQLSGVPSRIYMFGRNTDRTPFTTDTYFRLESLNMQFDNLTGIFGGATPQQLYQICAENGYEGSFSEWYQYSGSVMAVDFAKDVPLAEYAAVGLAKNINFQFTAQVRNISSVALPLTFFTVICYDGVFCLNQDGAAFLQINLLTPEDVIGSKSVQQLPYHAIRDWAQQGGSFMSTLSKVPSFAKNLVKKGINKYESLQPTDQKAISQGIVDLASVVSPGLAKVVQDFGPEGYKVAKKLVGLGYSENQIYMMLASKGKGGKKITKGQLKAIAKG